MSIGIEEFINDDEAVIFEPASWLIKIDFINQFIQNNNVLISILGEPGSGKTTFAQLLEQKVDAQVKTAAFTALALFDRDLFLRHLSSLLDLETKDSLIEIAQAVNAKQAHVLIIVDDAEKLPENLVEECLDALRVGEGKGHFHICLLSDFSLVKMTSRLARETYKDMIHSIELQPLNFAETKAYVTDKLSLRDQVLLTDERFKQFYELTEGNIVGINTQMVGFFTQKKPDRSTIVKRFVPYTIIPAVLFGLLGGGYVWFSQTEPRVQQDTTSIADSAMNSVQIELPLTSDIPNFQVAAVHQPMEMVSLEKAEVLVGTTAEEDNAVDSSLVVMDTVVSIPKIEMPTHQSEEKPVQAAPVVAKVSKPVSSHPAKVAVIKKQPKSAPRLAIGTQYTIQLLASRDKHQLESLANQHLGLKPQIKQVSNHGEAWYVLTIGQYAQRQEAIQAMNQLSTQLKTFKPWVRSTSTLSELG